MRYNRFYIAIAVTSALLILLIAIQVTWLQNVSEIEKRDKEHAVISALKKVEAHLQNMNYQFINTSKIYESAHEGFYMVHQKYNDSGYYGPVDTVNMFVDELWGNDIHSKIKKWSTIEFDHPAILEIQIKGKLQFDTCSNFYMEREKFNKEINGIEVNDVELYSRNIKSILNMDITDTLIGKYLRKEKINAEYGFGFIDEKTKKIAYAKRISNTTGLLNTPFGITVFSDSKFIKQYRLALVFNTPLQIRSITGWLILSILIILSLAISFYAFISFYLRQTRLAAMKSEFINNLTHEFNTPLSNIALAVETLRKSNPSESPEVNKILDIMSSEALRLSDNVERALQVAKMEKGTLPLHKDNLDLVVMITTILSAYQLQCEQLNGHITFKSPGKAMYYGDEIHLLNCICNILDNALKYRKGAPGIMIVLTESGNTIRLAIADNGIGMSKEVQKHIFEKFYRASQGYKHNTKGFGLGLNYVKGIIDAHGGNISIISEPGAGSTFTITLYKTTGNESKH